MGPLGSTLRGPPTRGAAGVHPLGARAPGLGPIDEFAALLLPMVRRGVRTAGGPLGLVRWLRQQPAAPPGAAAPEPAVRLLAEALARALLNPPGPNGDTMTDSRIHEDAAPPAR